MNNLIRFFDESKIEYGENVSFKTLTTYKTGGNARVVVYPNNLKELKEILSLIKRENLSYFVFGNGSNILASDSNYDGVIIKLDKFNKCELYEDYVFVESGYSLSKLGLELSKENYMHYAGLAGIPGTIGGAIYMNAGAYGDEIKDILIEATILCNDEIKVLTNEEFKFGKRYSILKEMNAIVLDAKFKLAKSEEDEFEKVNANRIKRTSSQPLDKPNCGSVFKNPEGFAAGKLIEDAGLKGKMIGGAEVSMKHANFIVNENNATSEDIFKLINEVKNKIYEDTGITLELEVKLFNF